jgi:hypothetical protein
MVVYQVERTAVKLSSRRPGALPWAFSISSYLAYLSLSVEGDRRGSNPRPSLEPQSELTLAEIVHN